MRIAVVLASLDGGGTERMRLHLIEEWISSGIEVDLVVSRLGGALCPQIPKGTKVFEIARHAALFFPLGLFRYIKDRQPTHILAGGNDINALTLITQWLFRLRIPIILSFHIQLSKDIELSRGRNRLKLVITELLLRRLINRSHAVVAVSKGVAEDIQQRLRIKKSLIHTIYNPTVTSELLNKIQQADSPSIASEATTWILYAGRLVHTKGLDILLDAYKRIADETEAHLVIMGDGPCRNELLATIHNTKLEDRVHIIPFQENPIPWIKHARILALPSRNEGLPNILIEALACGTQVVSTDCPSGPAEILEDGKFGQLVPVGDSKGLAKALLCSLNGKFFVPEERLRRRAMDFNAEKSARHYESVMQANAD